MDIEETTAAEFDSATGGVQPGPILTALRKMKVGDVIKLPNHRPHAGQVCPDRNAAYVGARREGIEISIKHNRNGADLLIKRVS